MPGSGESPERESFVDLYACGTSLSVPLVLCKPESHNNLKKQICTEVKDSLLHEGMKSDLCCH